MKSLLTGTLGNVCMLVVVLNYANSLSDTITSQQLSPFGTYFCVRRYSIIIIDCFSVVIKQFTKTYIARNKR